MQVSTDAAIQKRYEALVKKGESPRMAEMLAFQKAPGCVTDDTFFHGTKNGQQFSKIENQGNALARELRQSGGSPAGKKYLSGLARYAGDKEAWVSSRAEITALLKRRNWGCQGQVTTAINKDVVDVAPPVDVAEKVIQDGMLTVAEDTPELVRTKQQREDLRESIKAKRMAHWKKKK